MQAGLRQDQYKGGLSVPALVRKEPGGTGLPKTKTKVGLDQDQNKEIRDQRIVAAQRFQSSRATVES